eukprot:6192961-Pleurochrysis_carterae.AAC.1
MEPILGTVESPATHRLIALNAKVAATFSFNALRAQLLEDETLYTDSLRDAHRAVVCAQAYDGVKKFGVVQNTVMKIRVLHDYMWIQ